jgi:hypothetical protein
MSASLVEQKRDFSAPRFEHRQRTDGSVPGANILIPLMSTSAMQRLEIINKFRDEPYVANGLPA